MFLRNMRNLALVMGPVMLFVFVYSNFIQKPRSPVAYVGTGDPQIAAAREEGRRTLPEFLEHLEARAADESHFAIKFRLDRKQLIMPLQPTAFASADEEPDEYIWASRIRLSENGASVAGFIDDIPRAKGFHAGQPVVVPLEDIVDWGYSKDGVMQGNFTTKVLLNKLPAREAAMAKEAMGWR